MPSRAGSASSGVNHPSAPSAGTRVLVVTIAPCAGGSRFLMVRQKPLWSTKRLVSLRPPFTEAKQLRNLSPVASAPMQVEMVRWPAEENRLAEIRTSGQARLVLVPEGVAPPLTSDPLEDWVRLPASDE